MTDTKLTSVSKAEAAKPIKVAAPPRILSVFPNGVSMASNATVPTANNFIFICFYPMSDDGCRKY